MPMALPGSNVWARQARDTCWVLSAWNGRHGAGRTTPTGWGKAGCHSTKVQCPFGKGKAAQAAGPAEAGWAAKAAGQLAGAVGMGVAWGGGGWGCVPVLWQAHVQGMKHSGMGKALAQSLGVKCSPLGGAEGGSIHSMETNPPKPEPPENKMSCLGVNNNGQAGVPKSVTGVKNKNSRYVYTRFK